jgi:hypothetical protein
MTKNQIDGIALPSAQTGEKTYVLYFDGDAFADSGSDPSDSSGALPVNRGADWKSVFTLAKNDISVYEVRRHYEGVRTRY